MPYETINGAFEENGHQWPTVDLRSDTLSRPTKLMREAMAVAEVGDDVYGEDPTVIKLCQKAADLLQKEAACFVPSGTMGNLIAIMVHCNQRGSEYITGDISHTFLFEQGGPAQIAGVQLSMVRNLPDGTFCLEELQSRIRIDPDCHEPITSLIVVENTNNMCGGKVLPLEWIDKLGIIAKKHSIPVHMDGARLMNAAIYSKVPASRIVRDCASVSLCLSKSLGAPMGSLLLGSKDFIQKAKRVRKVLGGGVRQAGIVAAAGIVALDHMIDRLADDHRRVYQIAEAINNYNSPLFSVDLPNVQTNILMVNLDKNKVKSKEFLQRMNTVLDSDIPKVRVRGISRTEAIVRFVVYWEITDEDVELTIQKMRMVFAEFEGRTTKNGTK